MNMFLDCDVSVVVFSIDIGCDNNIGIVFVNFIGGMVFYIYVWSNGVVMSVVLNFFLGIYIVIVMDVNGCMVIGQVEVGIIIGLLANIECVDDLVVYCMVFNSSKICGILVYGFYIGNMFNNWISEKYWIILDIDFKEYLNGIVVMNVIVVNKLNVNLIFYINVVFVGCIYVILLGSLKESIQCVGNLDNSDWYYYMIIKGNMVGVGDLVGVQVFFDCVGFFFQVGIGVNLNDVGKFGVFGWLNLNINS